MAYDGEKLLGEFSVPVVPYLYVCLPGPRAAQPVRAALADALRQAAGAEGSDGSTLEGARDNNRIDLLRNSLFERTRRTTTWTYDIVPGKGRLTETPFVGAGVVGRCSAARDGKLAGVGTLMRVEAHDVVGVDGQLLGRPPRARPGSGCCASGRQNPYIVVDAVPMKDDAIEDAIGESAFDGENKSEARKPLSPTTSPRRSRRRRRREAASGKALASLDAVLGTKDEEEPTTDKIALDDRAASSTAPRPRWRARRPSAARGRAPLIASDPYYSEAVGLDEAWRDTPLRRDALEMSDFEVANAMLYATPSWRWRSWRARTTPRGARSPRPSRRAWKPPWRRAWTPAKARLFKVVSAPFAVLFAAPRLRARPRRGELAAVTDDNERFFAETPLDTRETERKTCSPCNSTYHVLL